MIETSARLLRLLALFQAQRYWSGLDLCERLKVTGRTLRRDVNRLRSLGYPVDSTSGSAGGYQLAPGATLPPLLLDDDEAVAVAVGLRTAASGTVSGMEEASLRALSKLQRVLPIRLQRRVDALHTSIVALGAGGPTVDAATLEALAGACRDCLRLRFEYTRRDGARSAREVEPHRLVHTGRRWYLAAWDLGRAGWRSFRVDRVGHPSVVGVRFIRRDPPDGDFASFVARSISWTPYPIQATIEIFAPAAAVTEHLPPSVAIVESAGENACLAHTGAVSIDMFAVYLASMGFDFNVKDPPELMNRLHLIGERFLRSAS